MRFGLHTCLSCLGAARLGYTNKPLSHRSSIRVPSRLSHQFWLRRRVDAFISLSNADLLVCFYRSNRGHSIEAFTQQEAAASPLFITRRVDLYVIFTILVEGILGQALTLTSHIPVMRIF